MSQPIRVAHVTELPPGKGKVVEVDGRQITVYNLEGRLSATSTRSPHLHDGPAPDCSQHGLSFDAHAEDSPARLHTDSPCRVWLVGDDVWMAVD
jgi:nitrite reductase/ring-hydroxylating ferredoxin subunit